MATYDETGHGDYLTLETGGAGMEWWSPLIGMPAVKPHIRRLSWGARTSVDRYAILVDGEKVQSTNQTYALVRAENGGRSRIVVCDAEDQISIAATPRDRIKVSWSSISGAERYRIERSKDGGSYEQLTETVKTAHLSDPLPDASYTYRITAIDAEGDESSSVTLSTTISSEPEPPKDLSYSWDGDTQTLTLDWAASESDDIAGYRVYSSAGEANLDPQDTPVQDSVDTTYTQTFSNETGVWLFLVRAYDSDGNEDANLTQMLRLPFADGQISGSPAPPRSLEASPAPGGTIEVTADYSPFAETGPAAPGVAQEARIYGNGGSGEVDFTSPVATVTLGGPTTQTEITWQSGTLTDGNTYKYVMRIATDAYPDGIETQNEAPVSAVPDSDVPATPDPSLKRI